MHRTEMVRIGAAGWVIPRQSAAMAAGEGSHLERYARVMNCVEINSSFQSKVPVVVGAEDSAEHRFL